MAVERHTILIVESDCATAKLYQRALRQDFEVITCASEAAASDLLKAETISALVLEPALQGGNGWSLLAAIKSATDSQFIPVIICSTLDERRRAMDLGATAYLVKPVLPSTLRNILLFIIQNH